ncbi:DUF1836 domain-containing protein [Bacillaceae bacterium S4-13-58]
MKETEILHKVNLDSQIKPSDLPDIDLYMDQVTQLFEKTYQSSKRNEEDKIMTKTMINNYAKGKLLFPIKNKKYSKEHILLINLIYQLKGALSIQDIRKTLDGINEGIVSENLNLETVYNRYLNLHQSMMKDVKEQIKKIFQEVSMEAPNNEDSVLSQFFIIMSMAGMSNAYRKFAEQMVDQLDYQTESKD